MKQLRTILSGWVIKKLSVQQLLQLTALLILAVSFYSCENDLKTIEKLSAQDTLNLESAKEIELIYSDSGRLSIKMTSPAYVRYTGKGTFLEFPKGMNVIFYKDMKESSTLTAKYALINEETNVMEARNNVEVINLDKGEKLNTERLVWDERKQKIYSNEFVKITTRDKVLFGQGFESDQNFDNWVIKKLSGSISIKSDQ